MDTIQSLALIALLSMLIYLVFVNMFKDNTVQATGSVATFVPPTPTAATPQTQGPSPIPLPDLISNKLPEQGPTQVQMDASMHPASSIYNPSMTTSTGILPQNQDIFEKQADFGSDVTNINQFYKNNPEVFSRILKNQVTNVAEWEQQSKQMYTLQQQAPTGPIQAANYEVGGYAPLS
jgi:hypothetical protein